MSNGSQFSPPEHLAPDHDCAGFDYGIPELNEWLKLKAVKNEGSGASRTYVICADDRAIGYYALSTSAVPARLLPARFDDRCRNPFR